MTELQIRLAKADDADPCARIMWNAFATFATAHNFPVEPGSPVFTDFQMRAMLSTDGIFGLVAERDGDILGSAFQDERGSIIGVGPVTADPMVRDGRVGRALMETLLQRSRERDVAGVRLVQTAYNYRSLSLYAKLGFAVREPLSVFQGTALAPAVPTTVRPAIPADVDACDDLCRHVHGRDRHAEVQRAIDGSMAAWSSVTALSPATRQGWVTSVTRSAAPTTTSSR